MSSERPTEPVSLPDVYELDLGLVTLQPTEPPPQPVPAGDEDHSGRAGSSRIREPSTTTSTP